MGIIKGKKLMLFVKSGTGESATYKSIGFATNHSFSTSASTINTTHKDLADLASGSAKWDDQEIDTFSWNITSEHLYADSASGVTVADVMGYYTAGTVLEVKFGLAPNNTSGVPSTGWAPATGSDAGMVLSGKAIITSLDINASVDDNASFSITLTGKGPVTVA